MTLQIMHVCQPTDGGAAVVVRELVKAGISDGDSVTVACPSGGDLAQWVQEEGARWLPLELRRRPGLRILRLAHALRKEMNRFDVVHLHSSMAGAVGRVAAVVPGARPQKIIFTPHGWSWYVGGLASPAYRAFERLAILKTDIITVVSADEAIEGRKALGHRVRIDTIRNGVDTQRFQPVGPVASRTGSHLLVQVGRLSRQKAQDRSLRALADLKNNAVRLRFIGDGPEEDMLRSLAGSLGVESQVEFIGATDPRPHIRAADIVLLPSRWEGMSLVLLEAMAIGSVVIAANCGGSEAVEGVGILIKHDDEDAAVTDLVKNIEGLLTAPHRRQMLRSLARERAVRDFDLEQTLNAYRKIWSEPVR